MPSPDRQLPPKLDDIARRARLSRTAVSLALRNSPEVSAATRERVQRLAAAMRYVPNPLLAAHMAHVRMRGPRRYQATLAFVSHYDVVRQKARGAKLYHAAQRRAAELGYRLELFVVDDRKLSSLQLARMLHSRGIHGAVVGQLLQPITTLTEVDWSRLAPVAFGYSLAAPQIDRVCHDHYDGVLQIMAGLHRLGYRRVGLVLDEVTNIRNNQIIKAAFLLSQDRRGHGVPILQVPAPHAIPRASFLRWLERHQPDAVFCAMADDSALAIMRETGRRIPEDIGFVRHLCLERFPSLAGMAEDFDALGATLIDSVVAKLNRNEFGLTASRRTLLIPGTWRPAASVQSAVAK